MPETISQPEKARNGKFLRNVKFGKAPTYNSTGWYDAVRFTCPKCGMENLHKWFGNADHFCNHCGEKTNIRGSRAI